MSARWFVCVVLVLGAARPVAADDAEIKKAAKAEAQKCQDALVKGDYGAFTDLTHPKAIEENGGRKKMVEKLTAELQKLKAAGAAIKSSTAGDPSDPVAAGKDLYIVVPYATEVTIPQGRLSAKGALVGVSSDGGKTWVFIDTNPGRDKLLKLLPDLPDKLTIPKKEPPVISKD